MNICFVTGNELFREGMGWACGVCFQMCFPQYSWLFYLFQNWSSLWDISKKMCEVALNSPWVGFSHPHHKTNSSLPIVMRPWVNIVADVLLLQSKCLRIYDCFKVLKLNFIFFFPFRKCGEKTETSLMK